MGGDGSYSESSCASLVLRLLRFGEPPKLSSLGVYGVDGGDKGRRMKGIGVCGRSFCRVVVGVKRWVDVGAACGMVVGVGGGMLGGRGFVGVKDVVDVDVACGVVLGLGGGMIGGVAVVVAGVCDICCVICEASNSAALRDVTYHRIFCMASSAGIEMGVSVRLSIFHHTPL